MEEEIEMIMDEAKESMQNAIAHLDHSLIRVRTGKASPEIFNNLRVDYYGSPTLLTKVANIKTDGARSLTIKPWEKPMLNVIERAIFESNMGFTPQNDGIIIRINIPPLTEQRRIEMVKKAKGYLEEAKIGMRKARKEALDLIKEVGLSEDEKKKQDAIVDILIKQYYVSAKNLVDAKEKSIMTI